jgi:hypothetical protein
MALVHLPGNRATNRYRARRLVVFHNDFTVRRAPHVMTVRPGCDI